MPKPAKQPEVAPEIARVAVGGIALPERAPRLQVNQPVAVGGAVLSETAGPEPVGKRRMRAEEAAEAHTGSGRAFARWLRSQGIDANVERRTAEEWQPLVQDFLSRPVHGHRRSAVNP